MTHLFRRTIDIYAEPGQAFAALKRHGQAWFPIALRLLAVGLLWSWYFSTVDLEWLKAEKIFLSSGMSAEEESAAEAILTPRFLAIASIGVECATTLLWSAAFALYLWIVARMTHRPGDHSLGQWFSFVSWGFMPAILGWAVILLHYSLQDGYQLAPADLDLTSLDNLWLHLSKDSPWKTMAGSFNLFSIWCIALLLFGYRRWTEASRKSALAVIAAPFCVFYAVWALVVA